MEEFHPTEESGVVKQILDCNLSTIEHDGAGTQHIASSGGVSAESNALACGIADFPSSRVIKEIASVKELVPRTRPGSTKIYRCLLRIMLKEPKRGPTTCVAVGFCFLTARPEHGQ
ncbi:MAG: hypothetical protein JO287_27085 [Pseudonocardiales bacterium]|nr:hypothetical protein [Pseudonocardiales bacterium]